MRTELSYYKVSYGKFISGSNDKNTNTYEEAWLFRFINIRSTQQPRDVPRTSPEGLLMVLTSATSSGPAVDS